MIYFENNLGKYLRISKNVRVQNKCNKSQRHTSVREFELNFSWVVLCVATIYVVCSGVSKMGHVIF